jgi:hypothetical protein
MKIDLTTLPIRVLVLAMGIAFIVIYGLMLIVVTSGLPDSWVGLIYVCIGLSAGVAGIFYFLHQSRILLVPMSLGVMQSLVICLGFIFAGG